MQIENYKLFGLNVLDLGKNHVNPSLVEASLKILNIAIVV